MKLKSFKATDTFKRTKLESTGWKNICRSYKHRHPSPVLCRASHTLLAPCFSNSCVVQKLSFQAQHEFPDLSSHNNHMAKVLTPELYAKLRAKCMPSGFTLDDTIQTGVDNPGMHTPVASGFRLPKKPPGQGSHCSSLNLRWAGVPCSPLRA